MFDTQGVRSIIPLYVINTFDVWSVVLDLSRGTGAGCGAGPGMNLDVNLDMGQKFQMMFIEFHRVD